MAKTSRAKTSSSRGGRRRRDYRRLHVRPPVDFRALIQRPEFVPMVAIMLAFAVICSLLVISSREEVKTFTGQIVTETRHNRIDFLVEDVEATERAREEARNQAPRVYRPNESHLKRLEGALLGLPRIVEGREDLAGIDPDLVERFDLTPEALHVLQQFVEDNEPSEQWVRAVNELLTRVLILRNPLLTAQEFQHYTTTVNRVLRDGTVDRPLDGSAIPLRPDETRQQIRDRLIDPVRRAGFTDNPIAMVIASRLAHEASPSIVYDETATRAMQDSAAERVETVYIEHERGETIFQRGDRLTEAQLNHLIREKHEFYSNASGWEFWPRRIGIISALVLLSAFLIGYINSYYPRVSSNPWRLLALMALVAGMLAITVLLGVKIPQAALLGAVGCTLFVAIVTMLAYDERLALWLSFTQSVLVAIALEGGIVMTVLLFIGCALMIIQLHELRHRNTLIRAGTITAVVLGIATVLLGLLNIPPTVAGALDQLLLQGVWSAIGALAVGFIVLGILPYLEAWFDITTGMTLAELRDPKQKLLRDLQQKAPGTYNHSLQVANIAEAAAETIGANGLLTYVGGLYHDIGKMNKPAYFVENQAGGYNKHQKLSPAMSLLVIIGHVKDGMELAREHGLPRQIQHFIESHHGTTLVQYFYHAAKTQAELEDRGPINETEFRYPGPKPQTKEAAILMLVDSVESATRAMADPNPSRIESLVRKFSRERLADGQFDQCDLTFAELKRIEDSIIKSMCAIYHGRISYPSRQSEPPAAPPTPAPLPPRRATEPKPATA